jgi:signal peptidase II
MTDLRYKAYGLAGLVFVLDRLSKWIIEQKLSFFDQYRVIPGLFDIVRSQNRGVAFGIFNDSSSEWRTTLLVIASLTAVIGVTWMLWKAEKLDRYSLWGFSLILGGAAGNLFDRAISGHVTDFLLVYFRDFQWPTFNVADSAIVVGSGFLLLDAFKSKRQASHVS